MGVRKYTYFLIQVLSVEVILLHKVKLNVYGQFQKIKYEKYNFLIL